jgi:hypothetical protein
VKPLPSSRVSPVKTKSTVETTKVAIPSIITGRQNRKQRVTLYGAGGVGKTTLAVMSQQIGLNPLVLDCETGSDGFDVARIRIENFETLRTVLQSEETLKPYDVVIVDNLTKCEELANVWDLANIKTEKGAKADRVEDYGWGKGFQHLYDTFLLLLNDLDVVLRSRHVITICHVCAEKVPNPAGDDYLQYQPRLYPGSPKGNNNIRARVLEWTDHLFYLEMDRAITENGKAVGCGDRTIYTLPQAYFWAKSRASLEPYYNFTLDDPAIWKDILSGQ